MTVKELKSILAEYDDDLLVILSKDGEGNDYSPLGHCAIGLYAADSAHYGEFYYPEESSEAGDGFVSCVALWPNN